MLPAGNGSTPSSASVGSASVGSASVGSTYVRVAEPSDRLFHRAPNSFSWRKYCASSRGTGERCTRLISKTAQRLTYENRAHILIVLAIASILYAAIFGNKFIITRSALTKGETVGITDSFIQSGQLPVGTVSENTGKHVAPDGSQMSCIVLFHNEYESLVPVLDSWIDNGLVDYVDEILFFLNGVKSLSEFYDHVPAVHRIAKYKLKIVPNPENLPIGLAIKKMVELASYELILLLEKDWQLVEPASVLRSRLQDSKALVERGTADLVRHRHRENPGVPIHALIMHDGRELAMMRQQPNLMCFVHHWQKDPTAVYPGKGIMYRCGGSTYGLVEEDVFCCSARYCQWTNNPGVFKKSWFTEIANEYKKRYDAEVAAQGPKSPFLDFEYYMNWRDYAWNDRNFTVAVGAGLFSHAETEHKHFNTFWYALYRLQVDIEEVRASYLTNETRFKDIGGVHYDPAEPVPPPLAHRYPVEFVRKYQVPFAFTGNSSSQIEMILPLYDAYVEKYRDLRSPHVQDMKEKAARLVGVNKASLRIPWRQVVTDMHFAAEKAMMLAAPEQPHEMSITLVTSLFDIGRHTVDRSFDMYLDALVDWLQHDYPKVVFTTPDISDRVLRNASPRVRSSTKFVHASREDLHHKWIGRDNYDRVQEIRNNPAWRARASWLSQSPQALLSDYNPLVMSKMYMTRDASRMNVWNTTHFLFMDVKHNCRDPRKINPRSDHIFRAHMFGKLLLTYFDYDPVNEVHGFEYQKFNEWLNMPAANRATVKVGRGGVFGGSAFVLETVTAMYDVVLTASLREGLMGTEENILSILMAQVPQYIDTFSNSWACKAMIAKDHKCSRASPYYNCAIFAWAVEHAPSVPDTISAVVNMSNV